MGVPAMVRAILLPPPATVLRKAMPAPKLNFGVERRRSAGRRGFGGAIALALVAVLLPAAPVQANDIAPFTTVFGTDVVHAGFGGMRDDGTGTLTVSGVS